MPIEWLKAIRDLWNDKFEMSSLGEFIFISERKKNNYKLKNLK